MNHDEEIEQIRKRQTFDSGNEAHPFVGYKAVAREDSQQTLDHPSVEGIMFLQDAQKDRARLLAIIDEMKQERAMSEWRPISEAPKDGTEIEGWCPDIGVRVLEWRDNAEGYWVRAGGDYNDDWRYYPTHYRPLPAGPAQAETQEGA